MVDREPPRQQVTLLGGPRSGKTALIRRLVGEGFDQSYTPTVALKWHNKRIQAGGHYFDTALQDTPGQDSLHHSPPTHSSVMVVYDCTSSVSFSLAEQVLQRLQQLSQRKVLVAAKCDEAGRQVPGAQGQMVARNMGIGFVETSAKTGANVEEALKAVIRPGDESPTTGVAMELGGLSMEDIKDFISFNADVDHMEGNGSAGSYSPPLPLSPNSPDSFEDGEAPEAMALVEETREGESVLTMVPMHVPTSEAGTQTEPRRTYLPSTKKAEELDKFWLRQFRKYMKSHYATLKTAMTIAEKTCWKNYLLPDMKPDKNRTFKSYSRTYKQKLFSDPAFLPGFRRWFEREGEKILAKRFGRDSPGFLNYYEHARANFIEVDPSRATTNWQSSDFDPEYVLKEF